MLQLSRTVRFCLNDGSADGSVVGSDAGPSDGSAGTLTAARTNTFSAWPSMRGLGRYYELKVTCLGQADPLTGYFINIKHIDTAVREAVLPGLLAAIEHQPDQTPMGLLMQQMMGQLQPKLHDSVIEVALRLTPYYSLTIQESDMNRVSFQQSYEFSAAHRLHVESYSDEQNQAVFGKCNNPAGHGHNYQVQVAVSCPVDPSGRVLDIADIDQVVDDHCIQRLDHQHLNHDLAVFAELNPSVENIVTVVWDMLAEPLAALADGVRLESVTVWETGKTACTYHGPESS